MSFLGTSVDRLPTPCLVVDRPAMLRNLDTMQRRLKAKGKSLRAHAKTHKSSRIAAMQREGGAIGICVAKLSEAEGLVAAGVDGVLITGPVVTDEAHDRLLQCRAAAPDLLVTVDDLENARRLGKRLVQAGMTQRCLLDLDPDFHRTGVPMRDAVAFAESLRAIPGWEICGIQAYAGHLQHVASYAERRDESIRQLQAAAKVLGSLRAAGLPVDIFSAGGTGTAAFDVEIPELTEIQAGSYVFMDEEYFAIAWDGSAQSRPVFEPSLAMLSTVVSANHRGFVTIDAGLKAMYRDGAVPHVNSPSGAVYDWFGDEYGKVTVPAGSPALSVGDKVSLSISHCDPTVNLFDYIYASDSGVVVDVYPVDLRGCCH